MGYDDETKRMMLLSLNAGVTVHDVIENTGFELLMAEEIIQNDPPTDKELRILREDVDPDGLYRK
jgi:glutaconate CoA-transferase subunit B